MVLFVLPNLDFSASAEVSDLSLAVMADYLLHEGPMGYSVFKVVHQVDTVGNRLKEVQDSVQDLAKFGKMVQLVSFVPFEYARIAMHVAHYAY